MKQSMDDVEIELSNTNPVHDSTTSADLIMDEYLKNTRTCTHTHTCNPPACPDDAAAAAAAAAAHSHTCYHTHTQLLTSEEDDHHHHNNKGSSVSDSKRKRPLGNREAVRKYRERKKAHAAYLEEEVKKLSLLNQQLVTKLQRQIKLEGEALRLRSLLAGIRAKIDGHHPHAGSSSSSSSSHAFIQANEHNSDSKC